MTTRPLARSLRCCLVAGLLTVPLWALAQEAASPAASDWHAANDSVGQFRRGHADVIRWEQSRQPAAVEASAAAPSLPLNSAADAVRLAWLAHPELAQPLARLSTSDVERIASGRWLELDPGLKDRVADYGELIEVAAQARKAWTEAVASQLMAAQMEQAQVAAQVADELAARMASVGNWSRLQQAQVQLARHAAEADWRRARYQAAQAQASLIQLLQLSGIHVAVGLPARLPALPPEPMPATELQQRLVRIQSLLPRSGLMRSQGMAALAQEAYLASHAIARSASEAHQLSALVAEETQLHYNGMLKSSWDLLAAAQNQYRAAAAALAAQRDFEQAQIDLQWVLLGGEPGSFVTLGGPSANAAASAGH